MPQPRKPTAILEAEGAFIRHPERARESEPETSDTKPLGDAPAYLDAFQKEVWADWSLRCCPEFASRLIAQLLSYWFVLFARCGQTPLTAQKYLHLLRSLAALL